MAALVLSAEPPRREVYEIERVALTTGRAVGDVCGAVAVGVQWGRRARQVVNTHWDHLRSQRRV
ncbi:MAG: hypothetical protein ACQET5_16590 [Halobacteriota archaeon]